MTKKQITAITYRHIICPRNFWILTALCAFFLVSYIYLVGVTAVNAAAKDNIDEMLGQIGSSLGEREFQYITLQRGITIDKAAALGLSDDAEKVFVSRGNGLSLNTSGARNGR